MRSSFIPTALLILSGCGAVVIQNERWYVDKGALGAVYFETLSSVKGSLTPDEWKEKRYGMTCSTGDTFAEVKREIEKLCSASPSCSFEVVTQVLGQFENNLKINGSIK